MGNRVNKVHESGKTYAPSQGSSPLRLR